MTDEEEQPLDRRRTDIKLDGLSDKIDTMLAWQATHIRDYHASLAQGEGTELVAEHKALITDVAENRQLLDRIVVVLEGEDIRSGLTGQTIGHKDGLVQGLVKFNQFRESAEHPKFQLTPFQRGLIIAVISLLTAVLGVLAVLLRDVQT